MGGRALLGLFGGLVLLAGYQVGWYGLVMLRGLTGPGVQGGIAFLDLLVPGRNAKGEVDAKLAGPASPQSSAGPQGVQGGTPSFVNPPPGPPVPGGVGGGGLPARPTPGR